MILTRHYRKYKAQRQLRWQKLLMKSGIGFRTEVLDVQEKDQPLPDYVLCAIHTRIRVKGRIVYRHVHTLLKGGIQIHKGDPVLIRYRPGHLSQVLVAAHSANSY